MKNTLSTRRLTRKTIKDLIKSPGSDGSYRQTLEATGLSIRTTKLKDLGYKVTLSNGQGDVWEGIAMTAAWALSIALCRLLGTLTATFWENKVNKAFLLLMAQSVDSEAQLVASMAMEKLHPEDGEEM